MRKFRHIVLAAFVVLCATGLFWAGSNGLVSSSAEPIPVCQPVKVTVGSHTYKMKACNGGGEASWIKAPPGGIEWAITIDGGMSNGSVLIAKGVLGGPVPSPPPSPSPSTSPSPSPSPQ